MDKTLNDKSLIYSDYSSTESLYLTKTIYKHFNLYNEYCFLNRTIKSFKYKNVLLIGFEVAVR